MQFDLAPEKECVFLEAASQLPGAQIGAAQVFDWNNKLILKLDPTDLGKLLVVLNRVQNQAKIFHDPNKMQGYGGSAANTTLELSRGTQYGFYLKISRQNADKSVKTISLALGDDEAQVLRVMVEIALQQIYGW